MTVKYIYEVHVPVFGNVRRGIVLEPGTEENIHYQERMTDEQFYSALENGTLPLPYPIPATLRVTSEDKVKVTQKDRLGKTISERELHKREITEFGKKYEINSTYKLRWEPTLPQRAKR